jgi:hypothetical protein
MPDNPDFKPANWLMRAFQGAPLLAEITREMGLTFYGVSLMFCGRISYARICVKAKSPADLTPQGSEAGWWCGVGTKPGNPEKPMRTEDDLDSHLLHANGVVRKASPIINGDACATIPISA